jgi:hypothetical protein
MRSLLGKLTLKQLILLELVDFSAVFYMLPLLLRPGGQLESKLFKN